MSKGYVKWIAMIAAVIALALALGSGHQAQARSLSGPGVSPGPAAVATPCANLDVTIDPSTAYVGQIVTGTISLSNCSPDVESVSLTLSLLTTCSQGSLTHTFPLVLGPNETRTITAMFPAPPCIGTMGVIGVVKSGNVILSESSATLTKLPRSRSAPGN